MVEGSLNPHNDLNHANASLAPKAHGEFTEDERAQLPALAFALGGGGFGAGLFCGAGFVGF